MLLLAKLADVLLKLHLLFLLMMLILLLLVLVLDLVVLVLVLRPPLHSSAQAVTHRGFERYDEIENDVQESV